MNVKRDFLKIDSNSRLLGRKVSDITRDNARIVAPGAPSNAIVRQVLRKSKAEPEVSSKEKHEKPEKKKNADKKSSKSQIIAPESSELYKRLNKTDLYCGRKGFLWNLTDELKFVDIFGRRDDYSSEYLDVFVKWLVFGNEVAEDRYEDVYSRHFDETTGRWSSIALNDQLYGILMQSLFDSKGAEKIFNELARSNHFNKEYGLWIEYPNSKFHTENQFLWLLIRKTLSDLAKVVEIWNHILKNGLRNNQGYWKASHTDNKIYSANQLLGIIAGSLVLGADSMKDEYARLLSSKLYDYGSAMFRKSYEVVGGSYIAWFFDSTFSIPFLEPEKPGTEHISKFHKSKDQLLWVVAEALITDGVKFQ